MRDKIFIYTILIIAVCIGGEFLFFPVEDDVRISFGTPVFFFFLLWSKRLKPIHSGALVGIAVVLFRSLLSVLGTEQATWTESLLYHANVSSYYFTYGIFFYLLKPRRFYDRPIIIAFIGMVIEDIAFVASVSSRYFYIGELVTLKTLLTMFTVSFFRSFFVLSFFNYFLIREANATEAIYKQKNEEMLLVVSNLFVEMVQLKKSMNNAEVITKACYDLYRNLMNDQNHYAKDALYIAGEVHEIKKDHQRIYSGLSKLKVKEQSSDLMEIEDIIQIVIESNQRYSKMLGKSIQIEATILGEHPVYNSFIVLSLINNLITNSIEAINETGTISVIVEKNEENVSFQIQDNGPGIPLNKQTLVFEPGYTTKYNSSGVASNGIGLSHIKEVIEELKGEIKLKSDQERQDTTFVIVLPIKTINDIR